MNLKRQSRLAFAVMVIGLLWMFQRQEIIARSLPAQIVQGCAVGLMIAARITFGRRSFHAAANPTAGGLVTTGPYRWLRHPIYAAISTSSGARPSTTGLRGDCGAALVTAGAVVRMYAEETLLVGCIPNTPRTARAPRASFRSFFRGARPCLFALRPSPEFQGQHDRRPSISRVDRRFLGGAVLAPEGLHAGLHDRAGLHGQAQT